MQTTHTEPEPGTRAANSAVPLSRERIIEATAACLHETGYDQTTIRRIAARLSCAVGSVYRYFRDKRELLYTVTQQAMEPAAQQIESGCPMDQAVRAYHSLATQDLQSYGLMFWLAAADCDLSPHTVAIHVQHDATRTIQAIPGIPDVVTRIIGCWSVQLGSEEVAQRCWMVLHGSVMLRRDARETLELVRAQAAKSADTVEPTVPTALASAQEETAETVCVQ